MLGGRYRLGVLLGTGGMAVVRRAFDVRLHREVAVKLIGNAPAVGSDRFAAEVRTLASFDHPNLVRLLDADVDEENGRAYLVMDLVEGPNLAERNRDDRPNESEVASIGIGIATALAYVHARGVIHRDVKPANILLGPDQRPRLADFGIARLVDNAGLTSTGQTVGTPAYLAPEQVSSGQVGPAADVYSLGLVLAESLSGRRIYEGTPTEVATARLYGDPTIPEGVPARWLGLLGAMTARAPADRPSAVEVASVLASLPDAIAPVTAPADVGLPAEQPDGEAVVTAVAETFDTSASTGVAAELVPTLALGDGMTTETLPAPAAGGAGGGRRERNRSRTLRLALLALFCAALAIGIAVAAGTGGPALPTKPLPASTSHPLASLAPTTSTPTTTSSPPTTKASTSTVSTTTVPHRKRRHPGKRHRKH